MPLRVLSGQSLLEQVFPQTSLVHLPLGLPPLREAWRPAPGPCRASPNSVPWATAVGQRGPWGGGGWEGPPAQPAALPTRRAVSVSVWGSGDRAAHLRASCPGL